VHITGREKMRDAASNVNSENGHQGSSAPNEQMHPLGQRLDRKEMETVLESSPAGIGIVKNRVIGWTNHVFYSMLGYEPGSLDGENTRILYDTQEEYERAGRELYGSLDRFEHSIVETRLLKKDGSRIDCRVRASKLDPKDISKGIIVVITDISELKLLQIQLQQAQKMEAIGVLAGGISHDFNNILMGIQGHLSLMQIDITDVEKVKSHTKHIRRLVKTAAELTSRLLGFARGGKYQISILDLNDLVRLVLNLFRPTRKDITIDEIFDEGLNAIDGDQSQLEQVFLNLLVNASQAMPDTGKIIVTTNNMFIGEDHKYPFEVKPGRYIKVSVEDTGVGMDSETQKKIFDPFFSTKEAGDQKGRGLGKRRLL
jgi:two-component system cell cycle sensor histidine kinase/response regulator CckA